MKTIEEIIGMVNKDNHAKYKEEVSKMLKENIINKTDASVLNGAFDALKDGNRSSAEYQLNWVGDTYIRELFTLIVMKYV